MDWNDIIKLKKNISEKRIEILKKVSIGSYNDFIKKELKDYY